MKLIWLPVLAGAALLAGCAGGKSTFECGATAEDQCVTMLQANEKAALKTQSKRAGGAQQLPVVAEPSVKNTLTAPVGTTGKTAGVMVPPAVKATSVAASPSHAGAAPASAGYATPVRPVDKPLRLAEGTGKIWVAAWVDRDGAYHADNVISVVTRPGEWR
jgi:conjugal transfer pilus assembly protein TraV